MKIGQAAQLTGLTISNIRFYERKGLLEPERNDQSKYRNYSEQDIRRLKQIILYRKMNMPIEKIASMLDDPAVSEELVRQQLQELLNKQQEIQGSIDLCRKLAADHAYDGENIDFYLNYVKEEEKKGHSFAQLEELVGDFSEYSEFYKVSGDPVFQFLFCKVKNQKLFGWVWFALWIALSVFFIVEFGFGDGHMPLVVKAIVIGAVLVFLWYDFIRYCRKNENIPLNTGKQQHHKRHGHNGTQRGHYVDCAGIVCIVSVYLTHLCNGGC